MDDIQIDNGNYLRVHNKIYDALARIRVPGEARQVFDYIIRKTYGYSKKEDRISLSQFIEGTGIKDRPSVIRAINKLVKMNMIGKNANDLGVTYWVNKHYELWKPLAKKPTLAKTPINVGENANRSLAKTPHTKDNYTKDKRQLRESAKTPHPAITFLTDFGKLFKTRFGTTYIANFSKDIPLVKGMLSAIEYDDLLNRAGQFLRDEDDFIKKAGYTVGTFRSKVNKYVTKKPVDVKGYQPERLTPEQEQAAEIARQDAMKKLREQGVLR